MTITPLARFICFGGAWLVSTSSLAPFLGKPSPGSWPVIQCEGLARIFPTCPRAWPLGTLPFRVRVLISHRSDGSSERLRLRLHQLPDHRAFGDRTGVA